jgi:hypothetical protein
MNINFNQQVANLPIEVLRKVLIYRRPHPIARLFEKSDFLVNEYVNGVHTSWSHHTPHRYTVGNSALNVWLQNRDITNYKKLYG